MYLSHTQLPCGTSAAVTIEAIPAYWKGRPVRLTRTGPNLAPPGWTGESLTVELPAIAQPGRYPLYVGPDLAGEIEFVAAAADATRDSA